MKASRTKALALLLSAAMLTLAACSTKAPEQAPAPQQNQPTKQPDPVTLNMWIMPNSSQTEPDFQQVIQPFKDKNPHVTVKVEVLDWGSAWTKITTAATSGEGPDLLQLGTTWVPAVAAMGALEPLTAKIGEVGGANAFYPASWNTTGIAGEKETYAIPWFADVRAAYYRTDVFQKAGVDPAAAFKDWTAFKAALQKVNGTEIEGKQIAAMGFPGKNDWNVAHNVMPWIWAAGGSPLSDDNKSSAINSDAAVDGIMFYTGLAREGLVPKAVLEKNTADTEAMFHTGDFAVMFSGPWLINQYVTPDDKGGHASSIVAKNYAVAPIPSGPKGAYTFFGGSDLAIFKASKHKTEAWELIKFLSTKEAQVAYGKVSGMLPAITAAEADMVATNPNYKAFYEAAKLGRSYPSIPQWGPVETALTKHIGNIWDMTAGVAGSYDRASIKKALDDAAQEVTNLLKQ